MPGMRTGALQYRRDAAGDRDVVVLDQDRVVESEAMVEAAAAAHRIFLQRAQARRRFAGAADAQNDAGPRSEEHTSELQSHLNLVCRLLLEKKKRKRNAVC